MCLYFVSGPQSETKRASSQSGGTVERRRSVRLGSTNSWGPPLRVPVCRRTFVGVVLPHGVRWGLAANPQSLHARTNATSHLCEPKSMFTLTDLEFL